MKKLKVINLSITDEPYAFITLGHNPIHEHIAAVNEGWDPPDVADQENSFYTYVLKNKKSYYLNVSPDCKGAVKATVTFWEEPYYTEQSYQCPECETIHNIPGFCKNCAQDQCNP